MQAPPNGRWLPFLTCLSNKSLDLRGGRSRIEYRETCLAAWDTLKDELFESLVCGMPDRVEAVTNAEGGYTTF